MKKTGRTVSFLLIFALLCGAISVVVPAKDLEPCYHCNSTGQYHCPECGDTGEVTCDGCGGAGYTECPGEEGKGKCDHGWYVCPSCSGDGLSRPIPADGNAGPCGQCGGSGRLECWTCHGSGWNTCTRCNGQGKVECQHIDCKNVKKVGWKCSYCMGTGYLLTNFWPGENNGIDNAPKKGDKIWVNGKSTTYGGEDTSSGPVSSTADPVTSKTDPVSQTNTSDVTASDADFSDVTESDVPSDYISDIPSVEEVEIPDNRNLNFEIVIPDTQESPNVAQAEIVTGEMTGEEQEYYASLSDDELKEKLSSLVKILGSAEPGRLEDITEEQFSRIAQDNGFDSPQDARMLPLYFEGHQDLGFPVKVTVGIERGALAGGTDIYVYHIADDKTIESLGKAEYSTYDDGSIESVTFFTNGFSSFFTAAKELDINIAPAPASEAAAPESTAYEEETSSGLSPTAIVVIAVICLAVIALIAGVILIVKKKK